MLMSIQSTKIITREKALARIKEILVIKILRDYKKLEDTSFDPDYSILNFMDTSLPHDVINLNNFTDDMLENIMDEPFYRFSMFDNYIIE
jgi:hypothetical protein